MVSLGGHLHKKLPISLWEKVFGHLPYYDILRVSATSKGFQSLIKNTNDASIKKILFLESLSGHRSFKGGSVHPAFSHLALGSNTSADHLYYEKKLPHSLYDSEDVLLDPRNPVLLANTMIPPLNRAVMYWYGWAYIPIRPILVTSAREDLALTVGDIFWAFDKLLHMELDGEQMAECRKLEEDDLGLRVLAAARTGPHERK
ncbi:hypothetical protein ABW20_dc0107049 [Dactylellina cionopaga]|nr:hypothetical protein ABW20_dc0107049 [Dactylellina cionopaga]